MAKFTNKGKTQPLAIGSLGLLIEPGQTVEVSTADMHTAAESPVVQAWVKSGVLEVGEGKGDRAEMKRPQDEADEAERKAKEQDDADEAEKAKAAGNTPRVPTPAPRR